jgi:hypothetical protein
MLAEPLRFFEAAPPLSGAEHTEGPVHIGLLHRIVTAEATPGQEGLGGEVTNPVQPRANRSKTGKYLYSSEHLWNKFTSKTIASKSSATSGQTNTLFSKLAANLQGPVGSKSYGRLSYRFCKHLYQTRYPPGILHSPEESNLIESEIQDLLKKGGYPPGFRGIKDTMGLSATYFLSPKKAVVKDQ